MGGNWAGVQSRGTATRPEDAYRDRLPILGFRQRRPLVARFRRLDRPTLPDFDLQMSVSYPTKLHLAMLSGDRCAMPGCGRHLSSADEGASGEAAHIAGERGGGTRGRPSPRFDPDMTPEQRSSVGNLIYLCRECHNRIDSPSGEREYPVVRLLEIKANHERTVVEAMDQALAEVGFLELEIATRWISTVSPSVADRDYSRVPLEAKIKKNGLSIETRNVIAAHLAVTPQVRSFIQSLSQEDPDFPARLRAGFLAHYFELRQSGILGGEELFTLMRAFARQGARDGSTQCAAQAVLVYLFETCEVFER